MTKYGDWLKYAHVKGWLQINGKKLCLYDIYQNNKVVEQNIIGWKTALAHARKWDTNLFEYAQRIEILNTCTGEVIRLEDAEKRVKAYNARGH